MTTQEIADRYYELAQRGQNEQIQDELYAPDAVSVEPENDSQLPLEVKGIAALRHKEYQYFQLVAEMHGGYCGTPILSTYHFACAQGMDVTLKGKGRRMKEQLGVFEVKDGKIVKELFFYNDFD